MTRTISLPMIPSCGKTEPSQTYLNRVPPSKRSPVQPLWKSAWRLWTPNTSIPCVLNAGAAGSTVWHASGHGRQTFVEAVENSCNPVFAVLSADEIGPERFYNFIRAFGFGQKTGIDFPGEGIGSIPTPKDRLLRWANVGFGQGISTTPIQLAAAIAAIANGGTLYRPYLVSEIQSPDGETVRVIEPQPIRRVLSEETARDFAQVMCSVVVNGSGVQADVEGYRVAGKTGTAQIPEGGRYIDLNMAAFVGFAPADDPVFVGVVMLYKVHATPSWGGMWAGPVFGRIVEASLEYMGIPRRIEQQEVVVDRVGTQCAQHARRRGHSHPRRSGTARGL